MLWGHNMKVSTLLISIILFGMVLLGSSFFLGDLATSYGVTAETNYSRTLDLSKNITQIGNDMTNKVQEDETSTTSTTDTLTGALWGFTIKTYQAIKMTFNIGKLFSAMVYDMAIYFALPVWFIDGILLIIAIVIFGVVVSAIYKWFV